MPSDSSLAPTLARLSFWMPEAGRADFAAYYARHLAPLLHPCGLQASLEPERPPAPGVFSRLFAVAGPQEIGAKRNALARDPKWRDGLRRAGQVFGSTAAEGRLSYHFGLYRTPARPSRTRTVGRGLRQGLWQSFGIRDGLPSSIVLALLQDRHGDLWIGTQHGGVCRYDGERFEIFAVEDGPQYRNLVLSLLEDREGHLWLGTGGGILRCDGQTFEAFTAADGLPGHCVRAMLQDRDGMLWFGTGFDIEAGGGVCRYDGARFTTFTTQDGLADNSVYALRQDRRGVLWLGTRGGVSRYDGQGFTTLTTRDGLASETVVSILEDRRGNLWFGTGWFGTAGGGVSRYDGARFTTFTTRDGLSDDTVMALLEDRRGELWFGTQTGGVDRYDGERFAHVTAVDGLADDMVYALLEDRPGNLWVGTYGGGVSRCDRAQFAHFTTADGLVHNMVGLLLEDRRGRLWFATVAGLSQYDGNRFTSFTQADGLSLRRPHSMLEDRHGRLWFSFKTGLVQYDGRKFALVATPDGLVRRYVRLLLADRRGNLWFATGFDAEEGGGVCRYDGARWTRYTTREGLADNWVWSMLEDRRGNVWFATLNGLSRYDGTGFTNYTTEDGLVESVLYTLLEDRAGNLWVGTWASGLCRYDGRQFRTFTTEDGLANNMVRALFEDRAGQLWVGTFGGGVSRYDGLVFQTLSRQDGLVHDKVKQVLQDRCGDYWLATEGGGVVRYRPQDAPPAVRLVEVVADRRYDPDQEVHLPDTQQLVIFGFQGRSWSTPPERLAYVYRLDGYETEWKPVYRPRVEYRDLPRGEYTFQVRAVDRDLNYSEPASVRVRVEPDPRLEGLSQALNGPAVDFVGESRALRWLRAQLEQAAPTELTVLLLGETGKGLAARVVHRLSRRRGPLIPVSCGSLPEGLVESELFGHEKGAFTGAHARQLGKVELAQGGTLFLDEVGDLPLLAQAKLLRLLEEGTFERVGGTQELRSAARIVAATNRDLEGMVTAGSFRQDLYYRLQVVPVRLPPLRERREDIPLLAAYFLERMASHLRKRVVRLSPAALARLCGYDWPGNVRELEHAVKRAVVVCQGEVVAAEDLLGLPDRSEPGAGRLNPEEYERQYLQEVLEQTNWVISGPKGAATRLGMPESSLRFRMRKLGLRRP